MAKKALITGASKRLGRAMSEHLAGLGWDIIIHYNSSEKDALELKETLTGRYPLQRFFPVQADLAVAVETETLIPKIITEFGKIDLLVNNASVFVPSTVAETSSEMFDKNFNIHVKSPFLLIRDFGNQFKQGNIINIVDTRITSNSPDYAAYSLSKQSLWDLTRMAALEFSPGIRVNAIAPGPILPPEGKDSDYLWKLAKTNPMKRPGSVETILKSLDFILENDYLTGQLIFADGGENLGYTDNIKNGKDKS
jgi:NAD(P)-dependent dehydrogenase (short-subunit alcohol dehydrogenase family)